MEESYDPNLLQSFNSRHPQSRPWVSFLAKEFTTLCPKTGWPDFAKIFVNYIPQQKMLESKSMKLYLGSFRQHREFHEDCVERIKDDLVKLLSPCYLEVVGEFNPRGGIAIHPYSSHHNGEEEYRQLALHRYQQYWPGKYTGQSY